MVEKVQASVESFYDEKEPYLRFFAGLLLIYLFVRIFRAIGINSDILDWVERGEKFAAGATLIVLFIDSTIQVCEDFYKRRLKGLFKMSGE